MLAARPHHRSDSHSRPPARVVVAGCAGAGWRAGHVPRAGRQRLQWARRRGFPPVVPAPPSRRAASSSRWPAGTRRRTVDCAAAVAGRTGSQALSAPRLGRCDPGGVAAAHDRDLGYPDPSGHPRLRAVLAEWLGRTRGVAAEPDQIHVTTGVSQSLVLLAQALGQSVWAVEDPGSTGAAYVLSQTVTCRRVPIDEHGLVPELIPDDAGAVLSTPSHQYPTGVLMPAERRRRLVDDCRERGRWLIEDDYDSHLAEPGVVPASVQALAPDIVIHVDSLSKLLAPGVRIGWIVAPAPVADRLRAVRLQTDLGGSVLTQLTVSELIASGALDRHLREARREYARRRMRLAADLAPEWSLAGAPVGVHAFVRTAEPAPWSPGLRRPSAGAGRGSRRVARCRRLGGGVPLTALRATCPRCGSGAIGGCGMRRSAYCID